MSIQVGLLYVVSWGREFDFLHLKIIFSLSPPNELSEVKNNYIDISAYFLETLKKNEPITYVPR